MAKKLKLTKSRVAILSVIGFVLGTAGGATFAAFSGEIPDSYVIPLKEQANVQNPSLVGEYTIESIKENDFSIHFLELGNKYTGDCTLVKAGKVEVLIDAGSKTSSIETITNYVSQYIEDGLDYVIITHAHEDHYAGFSTSKYEDSIFSKLEVNNKTTIIKFAQITKGKQDNKMYKNFVSNINKAEENGAKIMTCLEALTATGDNYSNGVFTLGSNITMEILKTKFYENVAKTENDHSVCTVFNVGIGENESKYLLTGDLEADGESSLVNNYKNSGKISDVTIYKAGHHGSKTSSTKELMDVCKPKNVCVCCCAGSSEYTKTNNNQFPTQDFINRVAPHTENIFVTTHCIDYETGSYESMNGNIIYGASSTNIANNKFYFSNNSKILKETEWFIENREWPIN